MNILIAGGSGFLGRALTAQLTAAGHRVFSLTRRAPSSADQIHWDAKTLGDWTNRLEEMDAVVHYDPDVAPFFFRVPRRAGIDKGLFRDPEH